MFDILKVERERDKDLGDMKKYGKYILIQIIIKFFFLQKILNI